MKSVLVSVISAQTLPNFLLIKELRGLYSSMVFISTMEMEGRGNDSMSRSRWIERAAGLAEGSTPRVIVKEDSWLDIQQKLQDFFFGSKHLLCSKSYRGDKSHDSGSVSTFC